MGHYYSTIDENVLTFSDIHSEGNLDYIRVCFERPNDSGFDFSEGTIPACVFTKTYGFSQDELLAMTEYLRRNELLIWQLASGYFEGGEQIAQGARGLSYGLDGAFRRLGGGAHDTGRTGRWNGVPVGSSGIALRGAGAEGGVQKVDYISYN